jgi:hypothetical protein
MNFSDLAVEGVSYESKFEKLVAEFLSINILFEKNRSKGNLHLKDIISRSL